MFDLYFILALLLKFSVIRWNHHHYRHLQTGNKTSFNSNIFKILRITSMRHPIVLLVSWSIDQFNQIYTFSAVSSNSIGLLRLGLPKLQPYVLNLIPWTATQYSWFIIIPFMWCLEIYNINTSTICWNHNIVMKRTRGIIYNILYVNHKLLIANQDYTSKIIINTMDGDHIFQLKLITN